MRITMTRAEYNAAIHSLFNELRTATRGLDALPEQYPKGRTEASRELNFRGIYVGPDFAERPWTAAELDRVVDALELAGQLTSDAQAARAAGMSLSAWRASNVVSD